MEATPAVSCICVTQNRRFFLRRTIAYFWRAALYFEATTGQTAELVIVDGSERDNADLLDSARSLSGERIGGWLRQIARYASEPSPAHTRTGWFHNEAVRLSKGEIIIHWDDDDWQDGWRIFKQWEALKQQHQPSLTYTSRFYWYHLLEKKGCLARSWYGGGGSMGTMLAYHRATWEKAPFRDVPQGEDNYFLQDCLAAKIPVVDTKDPSFCIYIRHNRNGSPLVNASYDESHTKEVHRLLTMADDLDFYDELAELMPLDGWNRPHPSMTHPMASPYANRQALMQMLRRNR